MSTFARITQGGVFDTLVELTQEQLAALQANGLQQLNWLSPPA